MAISEGDERSDGAGAQGAAPAGLFALTCRRPLLVAAFDRPQSMLSWASARPGFQSADRVAWLEVSNADLPPGVDAGALLGEALAAAGLGDAVAMMTARNVSRVRAATARRGDVTAACAATVGLSNAVRVGASQAPAPTARLGTINVLVAVSVPLTEAALIETISVATEARTAAVMETGWRTEAGVATGTGTDCIVAAAPEGGRPAGFAGLHTDVGQAVGAAVYEAVKDGAVDWISERCVNS